MRKYKGIRIDGSSYEIEIEGIFDPNIPDVITQEPTSATVVGEDGVPIESINYHYDPSANHYKVKLDIWDHFNNMGKSIINHSFGSYDHEVLYSYWSNKMTLSEWAELKMWLLTQTLWYIDFLQKDHNTKP